MRCGTCHGGGKIVVSHGLLVPGKSPVVLFNGIVVPCPDCNGSGFAHCCEGLVEQPDDERRDE